MRQLNAIIMIAICASGFAQTPPNTFDINYNASYKDAFNLKLSSRLIEKNNWGVSEFSAGGSYNVINGKTKLMLSYDLWKLGDNLPINRKYGLTLATQNSFSNFSLTLFKSEGGGQNGLSGRLDFNMRFDR